MSKSITKAEQALQKAQKSLNDYEAGLRTEMMEEAALLVDTTNPPPFYNFFDLISFSFERCVVESIRHTEARLPPRIVNSWVFTEVSEQEAEKLWKKHPCYKNSGKRLEDYVAFVSRDLHVEKTDFRGFTPRHTVVLLQYLMNISNNMAILTHFVCKFTTDKQMRKCVQVHGWYVRQAIDCFWYGILQAWEFHYMNSQCVPCDLLEYIDVYWRTGTHSRAVYRRLGYRNFHYEVPWHPSLLPENLNTLVQNPLASEAIRAIADDPLHSVLVPIDNLQSWDDIRPDEVRPIWEAWKVYYLRTQRLESPDLPENDPLLQELYRRKGTLAVTPHNRDQDIAQLTEKLMRQNTVLQKKEADCAAKREHYHRLLELDQGPQPPEPNAARKRRLVSYPSQPQLGAHKRRCPEPEPATTPTPTPTPAPTPMRSNDLRAVSSTISTGRTPFDSDLDSEFGLYLK